MWQNTLAQFINIDGSNKEYCWRTKIKLVAQKIGNNQLILSAKKADIIDQDFMLSAIDEFSI